MVKIAVRLSAFANYSMVITGVFIVSTKCILIKESNIFIFHFTCTMYTLTCTYVLIGPLTFETSGLIVFHIEFC